jgi:beta-N-acetylhexosaminidase
MSTLTLPRGPVMADVAGFCLSDDEKQRLRHPLVGGVILFRRNFDSVAQLKALTAELRALRQPELLIAVDHEGGRVQRFLAGFTRLPPMRALGELWDAQGQAVAEATAEETGYVLAAELRACGIDLSFTPVLDLDWQHCAVIGNRGFHGDPAVVTALASALQRGLARGGMGSCGKHFPGHGFVDGDTHVAMPQDLRSLDEIRAADLQPFAALAASGMKAVMPAHVIYPQVDNTSAGFSRVWLQGILRGELGFDGTIFSDDLTMEGAAGAGDIVARTERAFAAGCDMALVCKRPDLVDDLLARLAAPVQPQLAQRLQGMAGQGEQAAWEHTVASAGFAAVAARVAALAVPPQQLAAGPQVGEAH